MRTLNKELTIYICICFLQFLLIYPMFYAHNRAYQSELPEARCKSDMGEAMVFATIIAPIPVLGFVYAYFMTGLAEHGFQWTCRQGYYCGSNTPEGVYCVPTTFYPRP